ncbi:GGDEF domain-containing protein [Bradyrhizobium sp. Arg237L]|uniref:GGDEF domain-containing protein n=1 Tax=Bradyrhizobium sp. Arg237L TaxID=3003352 RepID=UPI00249D9F80|nr:GGDEF domain-containing protein [Bradyrhizobium sp. Arg237L]MDI4237415.1 GGDEF domain-containing protein [Bradyrhizobium sp. Arg237L]
MLMKKKKRAAASGAAKRKSAAARKVAPRRAQAALTQAAPAQTGPAQVSSAALTEAKATIRRLKAELAAAEAQIAELQASAETDFLLDILNRRGFERELNRSIAYIKRYHASGALVMLDVDRLKPINDTYGHAAGDAVLKAVVKTVTSQVRASDVVGRLGGDEFAVLLWNLTETDAKAKAAALEQSIDRLTFDFGGRSVSAGASAGVAILGPHSVASRALEEADSAMYVRKAQRRHEVVG